MRMQAVFADTVIAESDDTVVVEGNRYFPEESLRPQHFRPSTTTSLCPWKGKASYLTVEVDGVVSPDAAWIYRRPTFLAKKVRNRVAFWNDVAVRPVEEDARIRVLQVPGCPLVERVVVELREALAELDMSDEPVDVVVGDHPSPTLVVDGVDVATGAPVAGEPRCRMDVPTRDQVRAALEGLRSTR